METTILNQITPMVITYNEGPNLGRTLAKLSWAREVLIVDSFSSDETIEIVKRTPNARLVQRSFDSFAMQCNWGLEQSRTEWVLSLDSDYVLTDQLNLELAVLRPTPQIAGYRAVFTYCVFGRPLRTSLYPPRTVLYRRARARYRNEGHGHLVQVEGEVLSLGGAILHDDRKPLERWFAEQVKYAGREAEHLANTPVQQLNRVDRLRRRVVVAPVMMFLYTLLWRGLILDGWPGWFYVFQRTLAELILSLKLMELEKVDERPGA